MREMGILAEKAQSHIEHMRGRFTRPEQELSFWNQAKAWEGIADFHHSESDSPAAGYKSTHASRIASSSAAIQAPALGSAPQGMRSGSRVVIDGLASNPEMNGRAGVICGDFDAKSGQFTVQLDSDGSIPCDRGNFVPSNLRLYKHNPSTEWLDENGCVCQKNVDFSRECAKGHTLVPFRTDGVQNGNHMLMCRVCHVAAGSELGDWRVCSVDGCCGGYAVCGSCFLAPHAATPAPTPAASDEFCMQVFTHICPSLRAFNASACAGHWNSVSEVAEVSSPAIRHSHHHKSVLPDVCASPYFPQSLQRGR
jgi:hypothetical protein